jgi:hypothetical protein
LWTGEEAEEAEEEEEEVTQEFFHHDFLAGPFLPGFSSRPPLDFS